MAVLSGCAFWTVPHMVLVVWTGALGGGGSPGAALCICWGFALGQISSQGQEIILVHGLWL